MTQRGSIILLTLLAAGALWMVSTRRNSGPLPVKAPHLEPAKVPDGKPVNPTITAAPTAPETPLPAPDPEPEPELPKPVVPPPKPLALASVEEPPPGPELGELDSGLPPTTVMENVRSVFRQYVLRFQENPVGDNAEITEALRGGNPKQVNFLQPEDGMRVNSQGQLVDNWGTPFFFHSLSRSEMEIRSAGPDQKLWTVDDLVMK
ncbi:MAG: hypothetical protein HUU41_15940 [Bryobacteraceae bacterium]|nr:hypothetical protein [Bryobacteraceae bacterium]